MGVRRLSAVLCLAAIFLVATVEVLRKGRAAAAGKAFERMPAFFSDLNGVTPFATDSARADAIAKGLASAAGPVAVQQITVRTYPATGKVFCGS